MRDYASFRQYLATAITIFFVFCRIFRPLRTFVYSLKMCATTTTTTTIQPPENFIAVDAVDNGNSNDIHDLLDSQGLHDNIKMVVANMESQSC